jgi:hypothetical protein
MMSQTMVLAAFREYGTTAGSIGQLHYGQTEATVLKPDDHAAQRGIRFACRAFSSNERRDSIPHIHRCAQPSAYTPMDAKFLGEL